MRALQVVSSETHTCMTLTWWWLSLLLLLLSLSYKSQCWNVSIKKDFTYKRWEWRSWKKKRDLRWEGYNSLHWWVSWSELSKKITCQQAIKNFHLQILLIWSRQTCVNSHWQLYNNLFRHLKHNLKEKKRDDVIS